MNTLILVTILNILLWVGSITAYVVWNLNRKNKILEEAVQNYNSLFDTLSDFIEKSNLVIEDSDISKAFKADDEVGGFFETLKKIQEELNYFKASMAK